MTRMDLHVDPRNMCREHLLGNHNECHQLLGYLRAATPDSAALTKLFGHAARGQIDLTQLEDWHDRLADEMERRGFNHDSALDVSLTVPIGDGSVTASATNKLPDRCGQCGPTAVGD